MKNMEGFLTAHKLNILQSEGEKPGDCVGHLYEETSLFLVFK